MAKNLLVDWMNKAKANNAINPATNIQSRLANTNTASNVTSTPNLPTNTGVNLQAAQQPTQTKLDNLNNQTGIVKLQPRQLSKGEMQRNTNQAFLDRLNGGQQGQSRFIGLQKPYQPNTDLGGNLTPEYYQRQAEAQRLEEEKERNKPILNIPTVASEKTEFMSNETNKYADTKKALYDLQGDMYKNNRKLTDEELKQLYPEFNLKELKELQDNLRPVVKKGQGVDDKQISQYFPNLLPQKKEASNAKVEMAEDFDKQLKTAVNRGNKLLGSYNTLSKKGVKYLEDAQEVNEFLNYVKDNYKIPGVVTDYDILNYTRQQIPEINTLMTEMDDLMSAGKSGMTAEDYNTIFENGFDLGEGLSDTANALNNISSTITNYTKDNSSKWKRQLDNLGLNGSAITNGLNTASEIASIPTTMVGGLAGGTAKFGTALERIAKQQNINEDGSTDWNGVATDVIKGGGGALEVGFNTAFAIPTAIFHAANATELGQEITDDTLGLYQEGIQNILDGSFAQDLGLSKDTYLAKWYNSLDEETKADLVNELTVATLHKGSKALKEAKLEGEVAIDAITNAFQRGKAAASFQAWVEKGMADEVGAGGKFRYLNKAENRKAAQRIVKEGISEFKDALKENFRLYNTALKNRRGDITSNMNTLPDNRTFKEKAQSKINEAKETINNIKEGAKETVNDIKQGVAEGVNKGVDLAKEGINKGVETVKEGVEAVKNKVTSKKNTEVKPVEESAGWSNNKGVVSKVVGGVAKVGGKVYDTVVEPVATKGAEIITSTTNAQDKLFKAVSPTLNKLTNKRGNYEQKRQNADRTNELIVEYGNVPENTTEYYNALIRTKQDLWKNEIKRGLDEHKYTEVDAKEITNAVREAMSDDAKYPLETNKADIELLNRELAALDDIGQLSLERLEAIKQQINAKVNYGKNPTAGEVYEKGLRELNKKISEIEDQMISELPGEFTKFKKDYGALKDMEEDVLKMMLKDMKKKDGGGLIQNRGRIEGLGKLTSKPIEGILQFFLGESLGKAKDVNFNIKTGFEQLKNEYKGKKKTLNVKGKDEGETKSESPKEPTPKTPTENTPTEKVEETAPKKKSESKPKNKVTSKKSEVKEEKQLETGVENKKPEPKKDNTPTRNVIAKKSAVTEYVNETPQRPSIFDEELETERQLSENETAQTPTIFEEDLQESNLKSLDENETPQINEEEIENSINSKKETVTPEYQEILDKMPDDGRNYFIYIKVGDKYYIEGNPKGRMVYATMYKKENVAKMLPKLDEHIEAGSDYQIRDYNGNVYYQSTGTWQKSEEQLAKERAEDEAKAEAQKPAYERDEKYSQIKDFIEGIDNKAQKTKAANKLLERTRWKLDDGKIVNRTKAEFLEYLVKEQGKTPKEFPTGKTYPNGEPKVEYMIVNDKNIGFKSSKIENDYARSLLEKPEEEISAEDEAALNELFVPKTTTEVTGKKNAVTSELVETEPKQEIKANGGMQRQIGEARNAVFTNTILDVIESNGGLKDGYLKVEKSGLEPLYIEEIGGGKIAIGQTYIQEGDVMFDPEIVFKVDDEGRLQAETYRNDSMGVYEQPIKSNDPFLETREANLREFIKEGESVDKQKNTNIIGKNNSLTTKQQNNGGKDLGTAQSGASKGVQGDKGSRNLQGADGLPGTKGNDSGRSGGDLHQEQHDNGSIVKGQSAGPAIGQQQGKLLTRGEARAINQSSKDILEKHNFSTNPKDYTAEEIETLRQYEGAGGLTNKGEDTTGVLDQFYTPQTAIDAVWNLVDKYKTDKGDDMYYVLEPTVGTGRFIRDRKNEMYEGHEIDKVPGTIAQILHPMAYIRIGDFEDNFMDFTGRRPQERAGNKLDIVVGNPPYSQRISKQQKAGLEPNIKRSEEFFIKKGIDVLKDGGILAMVVPSTFLSNPMTYAKEQIFNNATLIDAYRLPEGVFPYTQVGTDIVVFKKVKGIFRENKLSDNKRFEEHPEKILGEVKERVNRFGKLEKYVDGGDHPLDKLHAIYEDGKVVDTPKEQAQNYNPPKTEERTDVKEKTTTEVTGTKNKVTSKPVEKKKPVKKSNKIENQTIIKGDKTDLGDSVFGQGEIDNRLLEYSKKTDVNGYVEGPVTELVENDPKNLNFYKYHAVTNDLYFAGDIYEKLEQLERDKSEMSEAQYKKQKEGLEAVMPEPYTVENPPFVSPLDQNVMEIETNEIGNVWDRETANYVDKNLPLKDVFLERFRRNVSSSTMNKNLAREYINGDAMRSTSGGGYGLSDEEKAAKARHEKSVVMEQVNEIFNDWLRNKLDRDVQQKILDKFNRENRSYVVPKYDKMPLAARGISKTFNGKTFTPQPGQIEGINFLLSKGAGIVAHGVGHGKTIEGVIATREAQLRGWNKRPLIVAPGPTLYAQWVRTIKELYPDWEIVNLGGLTKSDMKRLREELGDDPRNWVKDGQVAIISMQGFGDHIEFRPNTQRELEAKLHDVMETKDLNVRQSESLDKKISQMLAPGKGASSDKYVYSEKGDFLRTMYTSLLESDKSDFIDYFTEHVKEEYPDLSDEVIKADAEAMWNEKPVLLEDLGIDHVTVDEMHNFKNVFTSAKMEESESGKKEVNRYGQIIQGNSSARGQKMYLATQYIMNNNNNRNVFGLTATPFNNQPIEMYNMLSFVGKNELEKMGLTNINDFFSRFAEFKEGLAPKASGTELEYKFIMKDFANARDLQRTITQFVNYKGDSEDLIKPEKKLKVPVLKMSELQKDVQTKMEILALEKKDKGDVLKATNGMISNLVSPFIVAGTRAPTGWEDFLDNSPKLKYFADVLKQLRKSGKEDGMFIYMPVGQDFHELYAEALSKYAGVPREKIGIIDSKTSAKKDEIAEKFRSGEINVLIGGKNTAEGIDLQNNGYITAITSVGWNPTERVQVDGRVWRQGNYNNEVLSVVPLIENSADVIFMGKADQKGSRINNALEQMLFGGDGDLSPEEMMMSLLTEPEKKARTQINMQKQEMDKEIYGLNSQKDRLKELKERIKDSELDPEEIQKQIDAEKAAGRTWSIPRLKNELKNAKGAKEWVAAYKENNGDLPNIEDIDKQILDIEKQVDEIRAAEHELDTNEDMFNNLVDEIKTQQAENSKDVKSYQDYIDDIKSDFKNAKRFGSKEELKEYLANKKNNVLANDKNKITSK